MFITLAVFLLDQASKYLITAKMSLGQSIPVIDNIFHITYIHNPGAAFGLLADRTSFFIAVGLLVVAGVVIFYWKRGARDGVWPVALGLIAGGSLGNLVDRVRFGEVVDFIDFRIWPVFNLADSAIVIGAGLLIMVLWRTESNS
ncbi:MAG: signal peptidase II [Peptococcaceae bacterium]|nr:signal peptidase II [Peptococcaceae bacterium]